MRWIVAAALVALAAVTAWLAVAGPARAPGADARSPYVDQLASPVRGLSAQEVDDLLYGRGAGYARTAELNGYPGPRHVLDMADRLALTRDQRARLEVIFRAMQGEARRLGAEIVERERALAAGFAGRALAAPAVRARVETLAILYGRLRATHLAAHLETTPLLTAEQIARYDEMRGYGSAHGH